MTTIRAQRLAEQIKMIFSEMLLRDIRDPRLQDLTVTQVNVDRELAHANIYVNALGDETRKKDVMRGLDKASGFVRRTIAQGTNTRSVPQIHFHWDPTLAHAEEVHRLLEDLDIPPADETDVERGE